MEQWIHKFDRIWLKRAGGFYPKRHSISFALENYLFAEKGCAASYMFCNLLKCPYGLEDFYGFDLYLSIYSATFLPRNRSSKFAIQPRPSMLAGFLGLVADWWLRNRNTRKPSLESARFSCNKLFGIFELQMLNSNFARLSTDWESLLLWLIWIWKNGLKSCYFQMTENRAEFELNSCSPQTPNNLF